MHTLKLFPRCPKGLCSATVLVIIFTLNISQTPVKIIRALTLLRVRGFFLYPPTSEETALIVLVCETHRGGFKKKCVTWSMVRGFS